MTLVLLHPIGLDSACWAWTDLENAVALDLPGHGRLPLPLAANLAAFADTVVAQATGALDLVGVSLGGVVAQHVACRHPERVRSLLLACTSAATNRQTMLSRADEVERDGLASVVERTLARWFTRAALTDDAFGVRYARDRLLAIDPANFAACWRILAEHDLRRELMALRVPVTVVAGHDDASTPLARVRELASLPPKAQFEILPGPHQIQLEEPHVFAAAVQRHLRRVFDQGPGDRST